jgi:hypothetical protein
LRDFDHLTGDPGQSLCRLVGGVLDRQIHGQRFQFTPNPQNVRKLLARERRDDTSVVGFARHQSLMFERHQRLAYRGLSDAKLARHPRFDDSVARP